MNIDLVASTPFDYALSLGAVMLVVGVMLMNLRIVWSELRSSLFILNRIKTCLEEVEIRLGKIDATLERIDGDSHHVSPEPAAAPAPIRGAAE